MLDKYRTIAVIGAGMAGLACAHQLHAAGKAVTLFDKGRRPGGRLATRRVDSVRFDHGAQYATARSDGFKAMLAAAGGAVAVWGDRPDDPLWVGVPGMSAMAQAVVDRGVGTIMTGRHVAFLHQGLDGWHVRHRDAAGTAPGLVSEEGGELAGLFDAVVLALPSPQAAGLLRAIGSPLNKRVAAVSMAPCWALMLTFPAAHDAPDTRRTDGPLSWIARDSTRPGRPALPEAWVAHASPAWSRAHLEEPPETVLALMRAAFAEATGIIAEPSYAAVHRWRYALVDQPLGQSCLTGADGLVVCGDWCLGPRVEAAFLSGSAAADVVLGRG